MQSNVIFDGAHQWIMFGRDSDKPEKIIDTNQYLVKSRNKALLIDPGGIELFSPMLAGILRYIPIEQLTDLFTSHQDPDVVSSIGLWDQVVKDANLYGSWLWEGFIRHFGIHNINYCAVPDEGGVIQLDDLKLQIIPAHYLHSSANFHLYDPIAKILFSGDVGVSLEPTDTPVFIDNFEAHAERLRAFHQRVMPSEIAKKDWINRIRKLDVKMMCPQHGRIFRGDEVTKFLNWFEELPIGSAIQR